MSRLGGGIGTRGPGETKLETDRRRIRYRISVLKKDIAEVGRRRGYLRERRQHHDVPTVALVGYTNAGKSTLFNLLTGGDAVASNALFVTLDPLVRRVRLPDARQMLVSDTVGFIDRLPHQLVAAFQATLEEVVHADLLLHLIDASAVDRERRANAVQSVLVEVGAADIPVLEVFNKCDLLSAGELDRLKALHPGAVVISARAGTGRADLIRGDGVAAGDGCRAGPAGVRREPRHRSAARGRSLPARQGHQPRRGRRSRVDRGGRASPAARSLPRARGCRHDARRRVARCWRCIVVGCGGARAAGRRRPRRSTRRIPKPDIPAGLNVPPDRPPAPRSRRGSACRAATCEGRAGISPTS